MKWSHKDGGSGLGSFNQGKMLWAKNGMTCYLNTIDRSNYYEKIYEGKVPNQKYSRRFKEYYCRMQISKEGIIVRHNNTCKNKFKGIEGVEQISHDQVGKYAVGIYTYQNGKWVRDK